MMIGGTYLFEDVYNLPGTDKNIVATVTTAVVMESEKAAYVGVTDQAGRSSILFEPMTDQQLAEYKAHPEAYFGRLEQGRGTVKHPYELFEFFMESYRLLSRNTLLERLSGHPNAAGCGEMSNEELLALYCEGMVAASGLFTHATASTETT